MYTLGEWRRRLHYLLKRSQHDAALRDEMEAHRAMMGDRRRFGNPVVYREAAHEVWGWTWLDDIRRDVRFAVRTLLRAPGFAVITIASLALATGATTAIFSVVHGVLLRPLPFPAADRLVQVREIHRNGSVGSVMAGDLEAFRQQSTTIDRFAGYELTARLIETDAGAERVMAVVTDREFFPLLGIRPAAGRAYDATDAADVVVLSDELWARQFARDPAVIGRTIALSGTRWDPALQRSVLQRRDHTVIAVMPASFQFPYSAASGFPGALNEARTDIWIPFERSGGRVGSVTARLKPGVSAAAAAAELESIEKRLDVTAPGPYRATGVQLTPLAEEVLGGVHRSLWLLFGAVGLVLAAACANVASLLLARTTARTHEVVTRAALGAGPARLARQFLVESLLLSLAGAAAGAAIAWWGVRLLTTIGASRIPRSHEIGLDWWAFLFLLVVSVVTAVLFGLAPALMASRAEVQSVTRESGGRTTASSRFTRARDVLVVAEVALAFVLAFGVAGIMRELARLERVDTGMSIRNVVTLHLTPRMPDQQYFALEARVRQIPGVESAGFIQLIPLQNWDWIGDIHIEGRPRDERPRVELRTITAGYFQTMGIPWRGRVLTEADSTASAPSILVNEAFARQHFPGADALGRRTDRGTIVGVVGDVRQVRLDRPVVPEIYGTVDRNAGIASDLGMSLVVRTTAPLESIVPAIRAAVRDTNPAVAIFNIRTMEQVVADSLWELNLYRWSIGLFALLALGLAAIGLYGVIAYSVTSRMREFALRLVLGSAPRELTRLVLVRALKLVGTGLVLGAFTALAALPLLRRLPATIALDPLTFAMIAALMLSIAIVASIVPALRVAGVNPASALRGEQ